VGGKEGAIEIHGVVREAMKGRFRVEVCNEDGSALNKEEKTFVQATIGGKLRKNFIKIVVGDRVTLEVSPYDFTRGRIIYRMK
jgi:translation initiation factor IF-1